MNEAKRKYQKSCKSKVITFYKHEEDLLAFANSINFQAFVKNALRLCKDNCRFKEMIERE